MRPRDIAKKLRDFAALVAGIDDNLDPSARASPLSDLAAAKAACVARGRQKAAKMIWCLETRGRTHALTTASQDPTNRVWERATSDSSFPSPRLGVVGPYHRIMDRHQGGTALQPLGSPSFAIPVTAALDNSGRVRWRGRPPCRDRAPARPPLHATAPAIVPAIGAWPHLPQGFCSQRANVR